MDADISDLADFDPALRRRIVVTTSCPDVADIPKCAEAGSTIELDGRRIQIMHNGVRVVEDCYCGSWMTEIIRRLKGHHEPQEELVFHRLVERLASERPVNATMVELGSYWAYYSLWFLRCFADARAVALEPDPAFLEIGRANAALNDASNRMTFLQGAIGSAPGSEAGFEAESDGRTHSVVQYDLASLMHETNLYHVDMLLADVQGAEIALLQQARRQLVAGQVRFLIVSTHHQSISGSPVTHQQVLELVNDAGGHVIAEHSVPESYSGDGLVAASFDRRDKGFHVEVSHARAKDSLFGELEHALAASWHKEAQLRAELDSSKQELAAMRNTRTWRWSMPWRAAFGRIRSMGKSDG